jgi:hypothetical protein
MSYIDQWKLANFVDATATPEAEDFRRRVQMAMVKVAIDVIGEAPTTNNETDRKRFELAFQVLSSSQGFLNAFAMAVAANPAITAASSDGDLEFTVITVWNDLAGVR